MTGKRLFIGIAIVVVVSGLGYLLSIFATRSSVLEGLLRYRTSSALISKVKIDNQYSDESFSLIRDHPEYESIVQSTQQLKIADLNQKITITSGIPDPLETAGLFKYGNEVMSASNFTLDGEEIVINIFLSPTMDKNRATHEITRNYFWALLALDEYHAARLRGETPTYAEARIRAEQLAMKSYDNKYYPFSIK